MKYQLKNGKCVTIPDDEIKNNMKILELSENEAIQMWLEDEGYEVNEEVEKLTQKAKENRITATIHEAKAELADKKPSKPRTVKISDEKAALFTDLKAFLEDFAANNDGNVTVLTDNKLLSIQFGGKTFKIDLIQQREPKKK